MRILVVEDEPRMLELLRKGLYERAFTVMTAPDGEAGLEIATTHAFDAVVLDIGLPRLDGYGLMRALRTRGSVTPVLMLTARDTEDDIIRGLDLGADDYLTKPFSFPELVARLHSITRDPRKDRSGTLVVGECVLDVTRHTVTRNRQHIDLTRQEFQLLACLMQRAGHCVPRQTLIEFVWRNDFKIGTGALDVLVNSLRFKFDAPHANKLIATVRGSGYLFKKEEAEQRVAEK
jgi:DNA-binding response OmpR family regulator